MTLEEVRKKLEEKGYHVCFTQQVAGVPKLHGMLKVFSEGEHVYLDLEEDHEDNITFSHRTGFFKGTFQATGLKLHHSFIDKRAFELSEERCRKLADLALEFL